MRTFKEYRRQKLNEAPAINTYHTKEVLAKQAENIYSHIHATHSSSEEISPGIYHQLLPSKHHLYYGYRDGKAVEHSVIDHEHRQQGVAKKDGDVSVIHAIMNHHIDKHGKLYSDSQNGNGSRNMWMNFIKHNPRHKFSYVNDKTGTETSITDIDKQHHDIWGKSNPFNQYENIRVKAERVRTS